MGEMPLTKDGDYDVETLDRWKKKKAEAKKSRKTAPVKEELSENEKQRRIMEAKRAKERDITIPPIKNKRRRNRCEKNRKLFCKTYFPHIFYSKSPAQANHYCPPTLISDPRLINKKGVKLSK